MPTSELHELLMRNGTRGTQAHFLHTRWGVRQGAPAMHASMIIGRADFDRANLYGEIRREQFGGWTSVPMPMVPEFTVVEDGARDDSDILAGGWRWILKQWLRKGFLRPTKEIQETLGLSECRHALSQCKFQRPVCP